MKAKKKKITLEKSSGNVFKDLGIPNPEEYLVKAELAFEISQLLKRKSLSQKEAAEILGIDQPKISYLSRGQLSGFSVERLLRYLIRLNQDVEIIIRPHTISRQRLQDGRHICVRYAEA